MYIMSAACILVKSLQRPIYELSRHASWDALSTIYTLYCMFSYFILYVSDLVLTYNKACLSYTCNTAELAIRIQDIDFNPNIHFAVCANPYILEFYLCGWHCTLSVTFPMTDYRLTIPSPGLTWISKTHYSWINQWAHVTRRRYYKLKISGLNSPRLDVIRFTFVHTA